MSVSYIRESVKVRLWGKGAGRCEYDGCNDRLWLDSLTKCEYNSAYIAYIIADKPSGPRGDPVLSELLKADIANLMILCDKHLLKNKLRYPKMCALSCTRFAGFREIRS